MTAGQGGDRVSSEAVAVVRPEDVVGGLDARVFGERYRESQSVDRHDGLEDRRAFDGNLRRSVVLRRLAGMAGPEERLRFLAASRLHGLLEHPAIVPVYEISEDDARRDFVTFPRPSGTLLRAVLITLRHGDPETRRLYSRTRLLEAFLQLCLSVDYAHSRGVIHAAIEPSGILLGDHGEVYLTDWKHLRSRGTEGAIHPLASGASFRGVPGYAAPEQSEGGAVDERTDVHALGAVLFEILTLEPLHGPGARGDPLASARSPKGRISPAFDDICSRATSAAAHDRFPGARALHDAVRTALDVDLDALGRQALGERHGQMAEDAAIRALASAEGDIALRRAALQNAAHALALDPSNAPAQRAISKLMQEDMRRPPPEVDEELRRAETAQVRAVGRFAAPVYAVFALAAAANVLPNLRSPGWFAAMCVPNVVAIALWLRLIRTDQPTRALGLVACAASSATIAATSGLFGALVLVPSLAVANTLSMNLALLRRDRHWVLLMGIAAMVVPFALEESGLLTAIHRFDGGSMSVLSATRTFTLTQARAGLVVNNLMAIVAPPLFAWFMSDALVDANRRAHLLSWQLRRLLRGRSSPVAPPATDGRSSNGPGETAEGPGLAAGQTQGVGSAATFAVPAAPLGPSPFTSDLAPPSERYVGERVLGVGGMGEVLLCHDGNIGRSIALKRMHGVLGDRPETQRRFLREARLQGQLEHPTVVPVYDLGVDPGGKPFFTMKRVTGRTLEGVIGALTAGDPAATEQFTRRRLLAIFQQVCRGAAYAHARGVAHRDLKPGNIMIGQWGEVYILDWGLAKIVGESRGMDTGDDPKTGQWQAMGTPGYMAPEQTLDAASVDQRADVYALGAILFEMLALRPLHDGETLGELLRSTQVGADASVSARAPERDSPPELDAICVRATALDPKSRHESGAALADAVDSFLGGQRDVDLRRELARQHARAAAVAFGRPEPDLEVVLGEASRALALDPDCREARDVLMGALVELPGEEPEEVRRAIATDLETDGRARARIGAWAYGALLIPVSLVAIHSGNLLFAALALAGVALASGTCAYATRPGIHQPASALVVSAGACLAIGSTTVLAPPVLLAAPLAAANAVGVNILGWGRWRWAHLGLCVAAVFGPFLLEVFAVLPPVMTMRGEAIHLKVALLEGGMTPWIFPTLVTFTFVAVSLVAWRLADNLAAQRRRMHLQLWHLAQLTPDAHAAGTRVSERPKSRRPPPG